MKFDKREKHTLYVSGGCVMHVNFEKEMGVINFKDGSSHVEINIRMADVVFLKSKLAAMCGRYERQKSKSGKKKRVVKKRR